MRFILYVLFALIVGALVGHLYSPPGFGNLYELVLYLLILIIGIDLGRTSG